MLKCIFEMIHTSVANVAERRLGILLLVGVQGELMPFEDLAPQKVLRAHVALVRLFLEVLPHVLHQVILPAQ
jgi:hypothetical protein